MKYTIKVQLILFSCLITNLGDDYFNAGPEDKFSHIHKLAKVKKTVEIY